MTSRARKTKAGRAAPASFLPAAVAATISTAKRELQAEHADHGSSWLRAIEISPRSGGPPHAAPATGISAALLARDKSKRRRMHAGWQIRGCPRCIEVNLITFTKLSHNHGAPPAARKRTVSASRPRDPRAKWPSRRGHRDFHNCLSI